MWSAIRTFASWLFAKGDLFDFYAEHLRSDLFNGFLTLAGFVLAAKTFIVVHMKKEVYDDEDYGKRFYDRKKLAGESSATRYGPLGRMSDALYWITLSSVIAAVGQFSVGLIPWNVAAAAGMGLASYAVYRLLYGMHLMKVNLDSWFEIVDDKERARLTAQDKPVPVPSDGKTG